MSSHRMDIPIRGGMPSRYERDPGRDYDDRRSHRHRESNSSRYCGGDTEHREPLMRDRDFGRDRPDGHHRQRKRPPHPPSSKATFGDTLQQLLTTLRESIRFFRGFEESYLEETHAITPYATTRIMDELWATKAVNSDRDPSKHSSSSHPPQLESSDKSNNPNARRGFDSPGSPSRPLAPQGRFRDHIQDIKEDFENALNCAPSRSHRKQYYREQRAGSISGSGSTSARLDAESTGRMVEKLSVQYKEVWKILCNIYKTRSYVQEFVKESEFLASYLDKSRNLWEHEVQGRQKVQKQRNNEQPLPQQQQQHQQQQHEQQEQSYQDDLDCGPFEDLSQEQPEEWGS